MNHMAVPFSLYLLFSSPKQHKQSDFNWQLPFLANEFLPEV